MWTSAVDICILSDVGMAGEGDGGVRCGGDAGCVGGSGGGRGGGGRLRASATTLRRLGVWRMSVENSDMYASCRT